MCRVIFFLGAMSLLLPAASCTRTTVAPQTLGAPEFVRVTEPFASPLAPPGSGSAEIASPEETSARVTAAAGGTITAGRYTVTIPAGALEADTLVTVRVREESGMVGCELTPHGIEFATAVLLTMDLTGTGCACTETVTIYWYDPSADTWVDVGGTLDPATLGLSTPLLHFSEYRAGRAGWQ